jgi:hypothetical protein
MTGVLEPPGERRETSTWWETSTWQPTRTERPAAQGLDRYLVHLELATDTFLGLSLLSAGLLGSENLGPTWPWLVVGSLLLATTITLFLRFAFLCWSRSPDPPRPPPPLRLPALPTSDQPSPRPLLPPLPARGEPSSLPPLPALPTSDEPSFRPLLPPLPAPREPSPHPRKWPKSHRGARTITALLAATVGIILGYTLLYWTVARINGLPAFYAAVGTLTTVNPPTPKTTTANLLLVSQELIDLVFLGGVVTVALGRAFNR